MMDLASCFIDMFTIPQVKGEMQVWKITTKRVKVSRRHDLLIADRERRDAGTGIAYEFLRMSARINASICFVRNSQSSACGTGPTIRTTQSFGSADARPVST